MHFDAPKLKTLLSTLASLDQQSLLNRTPEFGGLSADALIIIALRFTQSG